jgi:flavin-dependent dehydrogenase
LEKIASSYDVVICGAGLAGLTLARQITKELPGLSLLLLEGRGKKTHTNAINVGESTVEVSGHYLADVLGLRETLENVHLHKLGFRFFFKTGDGPFHERPEFGLSEFPPRDSFQLDRARLEADIKLLNAELGIQMLPECQIEDVMLGEGQELHTVVFADGITNQTQTVYCHWVIDAMGRRRFLQKKLGFFEAYDSRFSSAWFRLKGRYDVTDFVPRSEQEWHSRVRDGKRYHSTNHLMGNGRWVWLIPLGTGATSIGIVAHEDFFPFTSYNTYEKSLLWFEKHEPELRKLIGDAQPLDFQCLRHYSFSAKRVFSTQRWACTGDAAVFSDPFLSPGIDQLGFANTMIVEMLRRDHQNRLDKQAVEFFNHTCLNYNAGTSWIIQSGYPIFGESLVVGAKLFWDIVRGWALNGPQRFNRIYLDEQKSKALQPVLSRHFFLASRLEKLFKDWAPRTQRKYTYQFLDYRMMPGVKELYDQSLQTYNTLDELLHHHQVMLDFFEELAQQIFVIALADTMPEMLQQLPSPLWLNAWGIGLDPERWKADKLFAPASAPRNLHITEFISKFGVTDIRIQVRL